MMAKDQSTETRIKSFFTHTRPPQKSKKTSPEKPARKKLVKNLNFHRSLPQAKKWWKFFLCCIYSHSQ